MLLLLLLFTTTFVYCSCLVFLVFVLFVMSCLLLSEEGLVLCFAELHLRMYIIIALSFLLFSVRILVTSVLLCVVA